MDIATLSDAFGETWVLAFGGLLIGVLFGAFAQQSRFCLRAAVVEFARGSIGPKVTVWLLVFTAAISGTQLFAGADQIATHEARQIASPQSLSGALVGGLLFGSGMILARGCASRLLVLSATGNLRALLSGLVFAVFAQASLYGILAPARNRIAEIASTSTIGGNDLLGLTGLDMSAAIGMSVLALVAALIWVVVRRYSLKRAIFAMGVGSTIPLAWWFTNVMSGVSFEPVKVEAITFTGPSADVLMVFLNSPDVALDFSIGLVPGVFLGSFAAAFLANELQLQGFEGGHAMKRYLAGAAMMGFGGMLAGGCAVGAGVTGASVFALTAWITLFAIWLSARITDYIVDRQRDKVSAPV